MQDEFREKHSSRNFLRMPGTAFCRGSKGDLLPKLERTVDWEAFPILLGSVYKNSDPSKGGHPPYDAVRMFKVLLLQHLFNLNDDQIELQIRDCYGFCLYLWAESGG